MKSFSRLIRFLREIPLIQTSLYLFWIFQRSCHCSSWLGIPVSEQVHPNPPIRLLLKMWKMRSTKQVQGSIIFYTSLSLSLLDDCLTCTNSSHDSATPVFENSNIQLYQLLLNLEESSCNMIFRPRVATSSIQTSLYLFWIVRKESLGSSIHCT